MTDYRQIQRLVIITILIVINLSLGFVIELAPKAGKMIGLTKQERWAHHPFFVSSKIAGSAQLKKHKQENKMGQNWGKEGQQK